MTGCTGKRELNKAKKRAEIVEVATRSFFGRGYAATSMSAIADELGGSKATLWAHFSSKEELFAAVVDNKVETFSQDVDEVLTGQVFSFPALRRACLRFLDCLLRENSVQLFRLVVSEGERFPEINEMFYERGPFKFRACVTRFFETRFSHEEAERLTLMTVSAMIGYRSDVLMRPERPTLRDREAFIDMMIGLIDWPRTLPAEPLPA
ncbi:TetR/AcrR family transcriptional regulator [Novosphingobium sp. KA1]|uniref:TetR/AcrR family transcriptional regulator n=1 Tax=Novosphingobium sp. (strain KA1) TaxID=164608 RepID=UPI001A904406|nr:TetR/AcrR family transcriptional regulator [Novosphingobium sp. KA1]QSR17864.1 TetR family transcriptional regulator [Novosphingobium sp. KA1]